MSEVIPYTVETRPDTGVNNVKLGIWLFLSSEVMLFGSLFAGYILLRVGNPQWGHGQSELSVPMATLNTAVLITSSVTMVLAWAACMERNFSRFRLFMASTVALGGVFMVIKYIEYSAKFHHGFFPSTSTFMAIYFTFTGLHALHVLAGMVVNGYFWLPGAKMFHSEPQRFANRVETAGLFWHFVDLVWIFLFPVLYLL
ncbi:MAG TPA: cytochrome c oxidase subunit 3 [Thermoanaerobaculia bacterium]|nr:cytochrome c oxidase subunit 3 [Thermoanaerobaculia bacterium]